jgi:alpha-N-arabinofuranosidase
LVEKSKEPLRKLYGCALHYYCGGPEHDDSINFSTNGWYELLAEADRMEELIRNHWQIMGQIDTERHVKLIVDEWGAWHKTDPSIDPSYLFAYFPTLRDALVSGITLDIFNRHADKVAMANAAQLINNIHTSFLALGDRFTVTPIFHVFDMYAAHQGGTSLRTIFSAPRLSPPSAQKLWSLAGSCSLHGKHVVLTVVNPDTQNAQETEINVRGSKMSGVRASVLTSSDIHAHNTFEQPHAVMPVEDKNVSGGSPVTYRFAPASVTRLEFDLV